MTEDDSFEDLGYFMLENEISIDDMCEVIVEMAEKDLIILKEVNGKIHLLANKNKKTKINTEEKKRLITKLKKEAKQTLTN